MRVEVVYEDVAEDLAIPHFRPAHCPDGEAPPCHNVTNETTERQH